MDRSQARGIVRTLFPLATVVTPNIPEALEILSLISEDGTEVDKESALQSIATIQDMEQAAKRLYNLGPAYVLLKGGHLAGTATGEIVDVLYDGQKFEHIREPCVQTNNVHGTGCTLSTGLLEIQP